MSIFTTNTQAVIPAKAGIQSLLRPHIILYVLLFLILSACGSNQQASDAGSISFKLQLSRPTATSRAAAATSANICTDYGIMTINANVVTSSGAAVAAGNWSCSAHEGTVTNVPAGTDYTIIITGTATGGAIAWRGEKSGVGVTVGETTPAGTITVAYLGSDATPPVITSSTPSIDATGVPVTNMITAIFSEKMAASSINTTNFTVKKDEIMVSGSVVYDAGTAIAIFIPSNNLSYSTTYTATLTTDIEDMAGNNMASGYSWSFTTEDLPSALPSAPTGVTATAGSGQITINWNAVSGATSYNIYWSTTSSITKATGTRIQNVTSPYPHKGLSNGTAYYYVVTAANSYGESSESSEVNATPGSIDSTPPTGSISISSDALYTTSTSATLTLSASDQSGISQMCISNTTSCSSWEAYATSKSWTLPTGDGTRFVYAWFKDSTGNSNASPYSASIILDTTPPTDGTLTATAGDGQVSLSWSGFSDATSGIGSYRLLYSTSGTPDSCSSGTQIYSGPDTSYLHTGLRKMRTYYYCIYAIDNAGNMSISTATVNIAAKMIGIAAGNAHSISLEDNGSIWAWGDNSDGQLGWESLRPTGVLDIDAGARHTIALKDDGTVWTWGWNRSGQLGDGTTTDKTTSIQVTGLTSVIAISAGGAHTIALKNDGTVWTWGYNEYGQLGDGTTTDKTTSIQVTGLTSVIAVSAGGVHTIALKNDGTVWTWGNNLSGQLGNGTTIDSYIPIQINGLTDIIAISAGGSHTIVLKRDGTVWAWGANGTGQLGDGTTTNRNSPIQVSSLIDVKAISAGDAHTIALKNDGTVLAWGENFSGQLGNGTTTNRSMPVQVIGLKDVTAIDAGFQHTIALITDGILWTWGWNRSGQLGDGTTIDRYTPVRVYNLP